MSDFPGIGVMINALSGSHDPDDLWTKIQGKRIEELVFDSENDALLIKCEDSPRVRIFDDGQSCCESRYMVCEDDLTPYVGAILLNVEVSDAEDEEDDHGEVHEVQFLKITTSFGSFTLATHNEHNGYYGGFWIRMAEVKE